MSEFLLPLLVALSVPAGGLGLLLLLDRLEDTLDEAVRRRCAKAAAIEPHSEGPQASAPAPAGGQRPSRPVA